MCYELLNSILNWTFSWRLLNEQCIKCGYNSMQKTLVVVHKPDIRKSDFQEMFWNYSNNNRTKPFKSRFNKKNVYEMCPLFFIDMLLLFHFFPSKNRNTKLYRTQNRALAISRRIEPIYIYTLINALVWFGLVCYR